MKKAVDSFKIGCYSNKAVAQDGTRKKGAAKSKSFWKKKKAVDKEERKRYTNQAPQNGQAQYEGGRLGRQEERNLPRTLETS